MADKRLFSQAALDRLASPEQLDRLVPIADARGWLALGVGALLVACLMAWGWAGSLSQTLAARGTLADARHADLLMSLEAGHAVRAGMAVVLRPTGGRGEPALHGTVVATALQPARADSASAYRVQVTLSAPAQAGAPVDATIVLARRRPLAFLIPALR